MPVATDACPTVLIIACAFSTMLMVIQAPDNISPPNRCVICSPNSPVETWFDLIWRNDQVSGDDQQHIAPDAGAPSYDVSVALPRALLTDLHRIDRLGRRPPPGPLTQIKAASVRS